MSPPPSGQGPCRIYFCRLQRGRHLPLHRLYPVPGDLADPQPSSTPRFWFLTVGTTWAALRSLFLAASGPTWDVHRPDLHLPLATLPSPSCSAWHTARHRAGVQSMSRQMSGPRRDQQALGSALCSSSLGNAVCVARCQSLCPALVTSGSDTCSQGLPACLCLALESAGHRSVECLPMPWWGC